jgi:antitoxin CcdA
MRMHSSPKPDRSRAASTNRPTNLSLSATLVDEAKELGINISLAAAAGLEEAVKTKRAERWLEENGAALDTYNEFVDKRGLPLGKFRLF